MESSASNLFHGFSGSSHYINSYGKIILPMDDTCARDRRRSRKHQRFLMRKAFLQHRGLLVKKEDGIMEEMSVKDSEGVRDVNSCSCLQSGQSSNINCLDDLSAKLKISAMLGALPTAACSSAYPTAYDYDSGVSVSGSSPSSRPSSPDVWLKPGKCVAIDCEMVGTGPGGRISELARCSVVDYKGDVVYDKYITPELPITDYRTRWSGITKRHMKDAVSFKTAQKEILQILKDKRVIGHAVHNDFKVLKYFHPTEQTRDTSKLAVLNQIAGLPARQNASLKCLAWHILHKKIQMGRKGHSSVEDAQTCMELYKLVEEQVERDFLSCSQLNTCINPKVDSVPDNKQYLDDQYWPSDLNENYDLLDCDVR
ncbi:apoptosis-enhancing nuclease [Pseudophryne corroboree]|uniref:apoptosis-enhancing nuclease n=1 Tax=Pseudophryne corroboree TaxID=495146 RepID=UPI0030814981